VLAGGLDPGEVARGEYNRSAFPEKALNNGFADAHRRAGDYDDFSRNAHAALLLAYSSKVKLA
jgi:hypothetical protein